MGAGRAFFMRATFSLEFILPSLVSNGPNLFSFRLWYKTFSQACWGWGRGKRRERAGVFDANEVSLVF